MNIRYDIGTIEMGLNLDSRRWGTYLVNVYKDKLDFFKHLLPNIKEKPIEKSIKQFFKIVKIMIEKYGHSVTNNIVSPFFFIILKLTFPEIATNAESPTNSSNGPWYANSKTPSEILFPTNLFEIQNDN